MISLSKIQKLDNITDELDDQTLAKIIHNVSTGFEIDYNSTNEWRETVSQALRMTNDKIEQKNTPWPNASNIKYPLIKQAVTDYSSRTLPELIQGDQVVKFTVIGEDPEGEKYNKGERVSRLMSCQLLESGEWEDGLDKLLQSLGVAGTIFRKSYYSIMEDKNIIEQCPYDKVIVNSGVPSLEKAPRITHIIQLSSNEIVERQRRGLFNDKVDVALLKNSGILNSDDNDAPIELIEQHMWYDLDEDGYKEPYIVTMHLPSNTILRMVDRIKSIEYTKGNKIVRIEEELYFTDYHFIRSFDGTFYSVGFGSLLLHLNDSINTILNQLVDSGTLATRQGGFIGKGLRLKNGSFKFKMGEWKVLDCASGTDIQSNIYPMPVKEPSGTLFSLLGLLIQVGKDLSSSTDVMMGKQPAQNVASSTVAQLVEQGTKVFTAINKRLYRSLKKEYARLFDLNYNNLSDKTYRNILDIPDIKVKDDFNKANVDIYPVADPQISSINQRLMRAGTIQQLRTVDPRAADTFTLSSLGLSKEDINRLIPAPDPNAPPPPETQKLMAEIQQMQVNMAKISADTRLEAEKVALEKAKVEQADKESQSRIEEASMRMWKMQSDALNTLKKLELMAQKILAQSHDKEYDNVEQSKAADFDRLIRVAELRLKESEQNSKLVKDVEKDSE